MGRYSFKCTIILMLVVIQSDQIICLFWIVSDAIVGVLDHILCPLEYIGLFRLVCSFIQISLLVL